MTRLVADIGIFVVVLQAIEWVWAYQRKTNGAWRETEMGWLLMTFPIACGLICGVVLSHVVAVELFDRTTPDFYPWLRNIAFMTIPLMLLWQRSLLQRLHANAQDDVKPGPGENDAN